jgi:hypothetical protein
LVFSESVLLMMMTHPYVEEDAARVSLYVGAKCTKRAHALEREVARAAA